MSALKRLGIDLAEIHSDYSTEQSQTKDAFGFKWQRRDSYESNSMKENARNWLLERYLDNIPSRLDQILHGERKIILDAGCGSGFSALLLFADYLKNHDYLGVDISNAVNVAKDRFAEAGYPGDFLQCDIMQMPIPDNSIDIIFSEGVLHHTDSTQKAINYLSQKIKPNGKFLFYVYRKKAVAREFTDDFIREYLKAMTDEEAWKALEPLTKLGIELGKLNSEITISEDIPYLGIQKGTYDIQRFFYWNFCKLFYKSNFTLDEMNHINFDWFRPLNCHRQTPDEVKNWCEASNIKIDHINIQEAGITVVGTKH